MSKSPLCKVTKGAHVWVFYPNRTYSHGHLSYHGVYVCKCGCIRVK